MNLFKAPIMFSLTIDEIELLMDVLNRAESDLSGVADVPDRDDGIEGYAEYALITMHSRFPSHDPAVRVSSLVFISHSSILDMNVSLSRYVKLPVQTRLILKLP